MIRGILAYLAYLRDAAGKLNPLQVLNLVVVLALAILGFLVSVVCQTKRAGLWEAVSATVWLAFWLTAIVALVVLIVDRTIVISRWEHSNDADRVLTRTANYLVILTCVAFLGLALVLFWAPPLECRVEVPAAPAEVQPADGILPRSRPVVVVRPVAWRSGKK